MLKDLDFNRYTKIFLITGHTDLRMGYTGLMNLVQFRLNLNPYEKGTIFLFCGRKASVIKGLVTEGDGTVVLSKKLWNGRYQWPRSQAEAKQLTQEQFSHLMEGFAIESSIHPLPEGKP